MNKAALVKEHIEAMLTQRIDEPLRQRGFIRRKRSTVYERRTDEAKQRLDVAYDVSPRYAPDADAHVLPKIRILFPRVNDVAMEMVGGNADLIAGGEVTLFEPIEFVAPKSETPRWTPCGLDGFLVVGGEMLMFINRWAMAFLDEYQTVRAMVKGYEEGDARLLLMQHSYVYVAAAYLVLDRPDAAGDVLQKHLGAVALRKKFATAFEYIDRRTDH